MNRAMIWVVAVGLIWVNWTSAQQFNPYAPTPLQPGPGVYGYPGYSVPAYDPERPFMPPPGFQQPMMPPGNPYGPVPQMPPAEPYRVPTGPSLPVAPRPTSLPPAKESPPKNVSEPYFVLPDKLPSTPTANGPVKPAPQEPATSGGLIDSCIRVAQAILPEYPSEPFTTYEGFRYGAEKRLDNSHQWIQGSFLHWWTRRDTAPPLVTTGNPANPFPGELGNPDTVVLLGGSTAPREFSGAQLTFGMWLDHERIKSLEISGFWLAPRSQNYSFFSDATGNPPITQPLRLPDEGGFEVARPGTTAGTFNIRTEMDMHGLELNFGRSMYRVNCWAFDFLYGVRYLYLNDDLAMSQNITILPGGAGAIPFNGVGQPAGANILITDSFKTTTRFYGGQIGGRVNRVWRCFDFGATAKIAFGVNADVVVIDGTSTLVGMPGTFPGGTLAQSSNMGRHTSTRFSVVPEVNTTVGYQVTPHIRLLAGYTLLYWTRVQRASGQIDRQVNPAADFPTSPGFGTGVVGPNPLYQANATNFWAQGINVGFELKY